MLKLCGRSGKHYLFSQIYGCMKIWTKAWTSKTRRGKKKKHGKAKQKFQQRGRISGCGKKLFLAVFLFFCAASLSSAQWQNSQLVSGTWPLPSPPPCSPSPHCSLIFHRDRASWVRGVCFRAYWDIALIEPKTESFNRDRDLKLRRCKRDCYFWEFKLINVKLDGLLLLSVAWPLH